MYSRKNPTGLLERLRDETRAEHRSIERTLADLTSSSLTHERYCFRLGQFYGFYRPLETRLARVLQNEPVDFPGRMKTHLLRADLKDLGCRPADLLPVCGRLPALDGATAGFGCLYVLEGSTLGGQVISRHVQARLGVTCERGGRFFAGYGPATGAMWRALRAVLVEHATRSDRADAVIDAARSTFATLHAWCENTPEASRREARDG
jgi:heme oxygenase (biliverdin-IX-beta and delta-forming)